LQPVYTDHNQIKQVLINLISNASQEDDMICLKIRDTGIGIAPENLEMIFESLFTTKSKGIGLGLTVTKMLVEANEGHIQVESVLGKGSTFTVCLPHNP